MEASIAPHHHQLCCVILEMGSTMENMLICNNNPQEEKKLRPAEQAINCPRCDSISTKFCYYNNYSLSQPRYFCKSCRRYWTKGGTLRNVPVGGGCRKNKRSSSSSAKINQDHLMPTPMPCLAHLSYDQDHSNDLSLAIARLQKQSNGQFGSFDFSNLGNNTNMGHNSEGVVSSGVNTPTDISRPRMDFTICTMGWKMVGWV